MNEKAAAFSIEAGVSLLVVMLFLLAVPLPENRKNYEVLYITQLEHDLLKAWIAEKDFSLDEMEKDFLFVFGETPGTVELNGRSITIGKSKGNAVSNEAVFFDSEGKKIELRVSVFT